MNNTKKITFFVLGSFLIFSQNTFCSTDVSPGFTVGELLTQNTLEELQALEAYKQTELNLPSRFRGISNVRLNQEMKNIRDAIANKTKSTTSQTAAKATNQRSNSNIATRTAAASRRASRSATARSRRAAPSSRARR